MAHSDGLESHPAEVQLDMFGAPPRQAEPHDIRAELADALAQARSAPIEPMDAADVERLRNIFLRMAEPLPADEAAQLRLELDAALERLTSVSTVSGSTSRAVFSRKASASPSA
jgi:hypothetical protein